MEVLKSLKLKAPSQGSSFLLERRKTLTMSSNPMVRHKFIYQLKREKKWKTSLLNCHKTIGFQQSNTQKILNFCIFHIQPKKKKKQSSCVNSTTSNKNQFLRCCETSKSHNSTKQNHILPKLVHFFASKFVCIFHNTHIFMFPKDHSEHINGKCYCLFISML